MNFITIKFKKHYFTFFIVILIFFYIVFFESNYECTKNGLTLFLNNIFPSLFPFLIASDLLMHTSFTSLTGKYFSNFFKKRFNIPGEASSSIILGYISGCPIGAKITSDLKKQHILSKNEAERLISFTNNASPLFILSTVGLSLLKNKKYGIILLISHILSSLLVGIIFKKWKYNIYEPSKEFNSITSKYSLIKFNTLGEILSNAISKSISTILQIGGFVIFFSTIISILEKLEVLNLVQILLNLDNLSFVTLKSLIFGFFEFTNGLNYAACNIHNTSVLLCTSSFILGFGGLSILFQVYSIIYKTNISIKPYLYGKFLHGIFSCTLTYIILKVFLKI